jgi:hypothetical protein
MPATPENAGFAGLSSNAVESVVRRQGHGFLRRFARN